MVRDHGLEITLFQPFRDFEGMPEPHRARRPSIVPSASSISCRNWAPTSMLVCSNVSPRRAWRHRPRRRRFPRTGRASAKARTARRLRGARLGPPHQRPPRRLGDRAPGRSSQHRPDPRQLPHARPQDRRQQHSLHPRRQDFHRPARRRAADRYGSALLEPPFPQHARGGRSCRADFMRAVAATGYDGRSVARNLQRPVPRRFAKRHRGRRPPVPDSTSWTRCDGPSPTCVDVPRCRPGSRSKASPSWNSPPTKRKAPSSQAC